MKGDGWLVHTVRVIGHAAPELGSNLSCYEWGKVLLSCVCAPPRFIFEPQKAWVLDNNFTIA